MRFKDATKNIMGEELTQFPTMFLYKKHAKCNYQLLLQSATASEQIHYDAQSVAPAVRRDS